MNAKLDVAARLQKYLDEREISGNKLAKMSGVSQSAVSAYLRSQKSPNITNLKVICDALDITLSEFFADTSEDFGNNIAGSIDTSDFPSTAKRELEGLIGFSYAYVCKKYQINAPK